MADPAPNVADQPRAFCRKCGYALVELASNQCPECGQGFGYDWAGYTFVDLFHTAQRVTRLSDSAIVEGAHWILSISGLHDEFRQIIESDLQRI